MSVCADARNQANHDEWAADGWPCPVCKGTSTARRVERRDAVQQEVLERMRRVETRVTNLLRAIGMVPGAPVPDPQRGVAVYKDGVVHVTAPTVTMADVSVAAVRGSEKGGEVPIVLNNQLWGVIDVPCKEKHRGND